MENKQIVTVFVDENSKVVKLHGINSENEPVGGVCGIGSNLVILDAHRDKNGLFWEMKVIHPEFADGHRSDVNDVTLRLGGWKEAVEVAFLLTPNVQEHKPSERAWVRRVILSTDTEVILQTADDVVPVKVGDLKAGDKLINPGKALDEEFDMVDHNVMVIETKSLGEKELVKVEFEVTEDCDTIWIDGVPFQNMASRMTFEE